MILQMPEYSGRIRLLTEKFIRWSKKKELMLQIWTVNDPDDMDRLFQAGVDGIFSDSAEELIAAARRAGY
jgi:glycerophosphoryl diester phosphodiesterase